MNLKKVLKSDKKSAVKVEEAIEVPKVETKVKAEWKNKSESTVKAKAETKWNPKPTGKGGKSKKRF